MTEKHIPTSSNAKSTNSKPLNPYVAGGPLSNPDGRGFYGREEIFNFVHSALAAEQRSAILLYGQRRIGKSSILRQLPNRLPAEFVCVFFDLQGKGSLELNQVLYGLGRAIADQLKIPRPDREETTEETFADQFLERVMRALDNHPERLILLFDEFDVVDEKIAGSNVAAHRFMSFLRNLINIEPRIGYILVVGRKTEELSEAFNASLLKDSVQMRIGRLEKDQAARLIREPSQGYLRFTEEAIESIYNLTGGNPYCTQLLCLTIWSNCRATNQSFPVEVNPTHVDEALLPAMELGTLGLNWMFDGLTNPAHRIFLSALAKAIDSSSSSYASLSMIEEALLKRRIAVNAHEIITAPRELEQWDVINSGKNGFQFSVKMVGIWIRQKRPLELLEKEVRYTNPKAYNYYELAVEAHRSGNLDRAVSDYKGALEANPVFLEAQKGLATALCERNENGDLEASIEAHERVLEIDTETPSNSLLQVLLKSLESDKTSIDNLHLHYKRISEIDTENSMLPRAHRILYNRALEMLKIGWYKNAEKIFKAIGHEDLARTAQMKNKRSIWSNIVVFIIGVSVLLIKWKFDVPNVKEWRIMIYAVAGAAFGSLFWMSVRKSQLKRTLLRHIGNQTKFRLFFVQSPISGALFRLVFGVTIGFSLGYLVFRLFGEGWANSLVTFLASLYSPMFVLLFPDSEFNSKNRKE